VVAVAVICGALIRPEVGGVIVGVLGSIIFSAPVSGSMAMCYLSLFMGNKKTAQGGLTCS
jgi:hypothetical protein